MANPTNAVADTSFAYQNSDLYCDGVLLREIAEQVGTPAYVYSANRIVANVNRLKTAFVDFDAGFHYSLKANANLAVIKLLHGAGVGMDAVSAGEIHRALVCGVPASEIVFAGVGKTPNELHYALEQGVGWFNVESHEELLLLNRLAGEMEISAQVALRLNPEVTAKTHKYIATGHGEAKFGMGADTIRQILTGQSDFPNITINAIHIHIGSQLGDVAETAEAVRRAQALLADFPDIRTLNIGGGFPVDYTGEATYPSVDEFAATLKPLLEGWRVKLEPGRYIVADSGVLLMSALYHKMQHDTRFLIVDGSMTEMMRPALYSATHPILPLTEPTSATQSTIIAGPVCETADILHRDAQLSTNAGETDYLALTMAGAYGFVMASNYNQRPRPPEVLVEGDSWRVVRRRETWDDMLQFEAQSLEA